MGRALINQLTSILPALLDGRPRSSRVRQRRVMPLAVEGSADEGTINSSQAEVPASVFKSRVLMLSELRNPQSGVLVSFCIY